MDAGKENPNRIRIDEAKEFKITCQLCGESYGFFEVHVCKEPLFERLKRL